MGINRAQMCVAENAFSTMISIFQLGFDMAIAAISRAFLVSPSA
jgi:hypothetical protein